MTQTHWTDEQLSAFLDGELQPNDVEALWRDIDRDEALATRVQRLRGANAAYVSSVGEIDEQPMSAGLKAALEKPPLAKVLPFRRRGIGAFVFEHRAIAAGLICAVAVWGMSGVTSEYQTPDADGYILASSPLHRFLEETPSSVPVELASGVSATSRLTFATKSGGICRQYRVDSRAGRSDAVACRKDDRWRLELAVFGMPGSNANEYQTAAGSSARLLDSFIDDAITGAPLDAAGERQMISSGWTR
jgi:hypothetical protein